MQCLTTNPKERTMLSIDTTIQRIDPENLETSTETENERESLQQALNNLRQRGRALQNEANTFAGINKEKLYRGAGLIEAANELQAWLNEKIESEVSE